MQEEPQQKGWFSKSLSALGTFSKVAVGSTMLAAVTGGLSVTAEAAIAAGESISVTPAHIFAGATQGFVHNLGGAVDGLSWLAESLQGLDTPSNG